MKNARRAQANDVVPKKLRPCWKRNCNRICVSFDRIRFVLVSLCIYLQLKWNDMVDGICNKLTIRTKFCWYRRIRSLPVAHSDKDSNDFGDWSKVSSVRIWWKRAFGRENEIRGCVGKVRGKIFCTGFIQTSTILWIFFQKKKQIFSHETFWRLSAFASYHFRLCSS